MTSPIEIRAEKEKNTPRETKPKVEEVKKAEAKQAPEPTRSNTLTPEEQAIFNRVAVGDDDWQTITEDSSIDYSLSNDLFELPAPAKKLQEGKQFRFRWITRTPQRLDEVKNKPVPLKWWPVNSTQPTADFKHFIDPNNGCVSREDQMLVFKPWWMFAKERAYKDSLAERNFKGKSVEDREEVKKAGRDSEAVLSGKKRSGLTNQTLREEIHGNDVIYGEDSTDTGPPVNDNF